ncbi:ester cyclase [Occallatibacter riparius]|uniref:Ester cyclase n=1 Tax=Occallatibacter riparius TaxID=1002689 RepID=A0A9J7BQZ8_9BACT|nr:ester cyclase [Occallatibacter riparius]UWZ84170.1 ester cyclase [Occallatibacter riparius]
MPEIQNVAIMQRFVEEVINQGRLEAADELVHEDFVELDPLPGQQQGRQGLKDVVVMMRTAFPDIQWVIEETIASGDKVVSRFKWSGTHSGDFLGVPATGRKVAVPGVVIDRLSDGKMADSRILMDTLGLMQQLGVIPGPPPA